MPPSPDQKPESAPKGPDIGKILLPKKESGPTIDSAQRVNAGVLLQQEIGATLPAPETRTAPTRLTPTPTAPVDTAGKPLAPAPAVEESATKPLQTYRGDMESVVANKGISAVSVAAAEAERRGKQPLNLHLSAEQKTRVVSIAMIIGGILLVGVAAAALVLVLSRPTSVPTPAEVKAPFVYVDDTKTLSIPATQQSRLEIVTTLLAAREQANLSLGLIQWLQLVEPSAEPNGSYRWISTNDFLSIVAPAAPTEILRTLSDTFLLGIHSFDENQPFLLLQADAYETAYAGMLAWERTIRDDLNPLFNRTVSPTLKNTKSTTEESPRFLQTNFIDKVVENRDVRLIQNDAGDILLLWTFLGRNIILITTNEFTLREVISRLNTAPVVSIPTK